jgi:hypothetical protein
MMPEQDVVMTKAGAVTAVEVRAGGAYTTACNVGAATQEAAGHTEDHCLEPLIDTLFDRLAEILDNEWSTREEPKAA